jgi:MFS family permease
LVAVFAVQVAVTFRMHGSPRDMAGVFIAGLIPGIVLGPLAGACADRWDPKRVMIASDLARALLVLLLPLASRIREMQAISFAIGCVSSFFNPAQAIALPLLVRRDGLLAATARMQQSTQLVRMASPALASALLGWCGERTCYCADAASFIFSAALLSALRYPRPRAVSKVSRISMELAAGVKSILGNRALSRVVFSLAMGTFAAGCFASLAAVYVRDVLHCGPPELAVIGSLIGAGTLVAATAISRYSRGRDSRTLMRAGMTGVGLSVFLFAWIPQPASALIGSAGMGLSAAMAIAGATTTLLGETPPELRGRVSGASASLTACAQLAAMLLSGAAAGWIGIRGVFLVSATLLFATAAYTGSIPNRHREDLHGSRTEF